MMYEMYNFLEPVVCMHRERVHDCVVASLLYQILSSSCISGIGLCNFVHLGAFTTTSTCTCHSSVNS